MRGNALPSPRALQELHSEDPIWGVGEGMPVPGTLTLSLAVNV